MLRVLLCLSRLIFQIPSIWYKHHLCRSYRSRDMSVWPLPVVAFGSKFTDPYLDLYFTKFFKNLGLFFFSCQNIPYQFSSKSEMVMSDFISKLVDLAWNYLYGWKNVSIHTHNKYTYRISIDRCNNRFFNRSNAHPIRKKATFIYWLKCQRKHLFYICTSWRKQT